MRVVTVVTIDYDSDSSDCRDNSDCKDNSGSSDSGYSSESSDSSDQTQLDAHRRRELGQNFSLVIEDKLRLSFERRWVFGILIVI